jgi:trigger factor
VPGFRPGKAPRGVLVKRIGEEALAQEVREAIIDDATPHAIREHDLHAIHAHAHGDAPEQGEPFQFELHLDLYPEFELPDPSEVVLDTEPEPVGEGQVEETVENLRREHATMVPVDRPAEPGDQVLIQTVDEDDRPREEGSVMPVDLETVGEQLAEQLVGHGIDDVVELQLEDPSQPDEEGQPGRTTMRVKVADVKAKDKPEPDDEFAKTLGFEAWDEVTKAIRDSLEGQAREKADEERREEFVDKLMEQTDVELPGYLVNRRKLQLLENLGQDLQRQGIDMDGYLGRLEADGKREEFEAELQESAEKGVKRDLVLEKLLETHPVEVSEEELQQAIRHLAMRENKDPAAFRRERGEEWVRNYRFLLMRDRALRQVVAGRTGDGEAEEDAGPQAGEGDEPGDEEPAEDAQG